MRNDISNSIRGDNVAQNNRDIEVGGTSDYAAPEMVSLGRSENLIQGNFYVGFSDSGNQWMWHQ